MTKSQSILKQEVIEALIDNPNPNKQPQLAITNISLTINSNLSKNAYEWVQSNQQQRYKQNQHKHFPKDASIHTNRMPVYRQNEAFYLSRFCEEKYINLLHNNLGLKPPIFILN